MSRHLSSQSIDHVVLERGRIADSWRTRRWDSLRLLTPNWMLRLPGCEYARDPDGYLSVQDLVGFLQAYAESSAAPVHENVGVRGVRADGDNFVVLTDDDRWFARSVVVATGMPCPVLPAASRAVPADIYSLAASDYKNPGQLPAGGVLVVGGSASGVQIADELLASGRHVTLAVGEHVRVPRRYRGKDILRWLDELGTLDERWDEIEDLIKARHLPSLQLIGASRNLDLNTLQSAGAEIVGKLVGVRDGMLQFSGGLRNTCDLADLKLNRLLDAIDVRAGGRGERPEPTTISSPRLGISLSSREIRSIVWATGFAPDFSWLSGPAFDPSGRLRHDGGVTSWPGLFVLGLPLLRRRRSTYIDGARHDVADLTGRIVEHLARTSAATARVGT